MKVIHIKERGGDELSEYKKAVKALKYASETISDLTEDMEEEHGFGERGYSDRYNNRGGYGDRYGERGGYYPRDMYRRDDMYEMDERRMRDSRGHYM